MLKEREMKISTILVAANVMNTNTIIYPCQFQAVKRYLKENIRES